ncbi:hypothetical protein [Streptomyces chartreusis]
MAMLTCAAPDRHTFTDRRLYRPSPRSADRDASSRRGRIRDEALELVTRSRSCLSEAPAGEGDTGVVQDEVSAVKPGNEKCCNGPLDVAPLALLCCSQGVTMYEGFEIEPNSWELSGARVSKEIADDEDHLPEGSDNRSIEVAEVVGVAVLVLTWTGPPLAQALASRVTDALWQSFRRVLSQLSELRERHPNGVYLTIVRTEDEQLNMRIPGNLTEEAHQALIRDFDALVRGGTDTAPIRVRWDEETGKWAKAKAAP